MPLSIASAPGFRSAVNDEDVEECSAVALTVGKATGREAPEVGG